MGSNAATIVVLESIQSPLPPVPIQSLKISLKSKPSQISLNNLNTNGSLAAVVVKNAYKTYSDGVPILDNFNMSVPSGEIYSLLGASGCGKTTMLSCIVGTLKLDSGDVFVFGQRPGSKGSGIPGRCIGYMPQGVTLYAALSIKETLEYFGRLYGMTKIEIQSRIEFLVSFLDLPSASQLVGTLSGGQQRRTSLAACLLHEPSLLILDEPTVGVDPLMRETIWNHLREITQKKQTTVIITTHYIEESKASHKIGLMRNGRLLIEDSPRALLRAHNTNLLEDIVLQLCQKDEYFILEKEKNFGLNSHPFQKDSLAHGQNKLSQSEEDNVVGLTFKERHKEFDQMSIQSCKIPGEFINSRNNSFKSQNANWIHKIIALFIRNILLLIRNPKTLYIAFFAPAFHILIVNSAIGPIPKHTKFGVVVPEINYDLNFCNNPGLQMGCDFDYWSCNYINLLSKSVITPISFHTKEEALESIIQGKTVGYMYFPENYTIHLRDRFIANRFAMEDSLTESNIELRLDTTNYFTGLLLQKDLYETFQIYARELMTFCDFPVYQAELPFKFNAIYGTIGSKYEDYISPAVLILITFIVPVSTSAYALISDRNQGTLDRTMVAGATILDILTAHFLSESILILIQTGISYSVVVFVFQWEIQCSTLAFLSILSLTGIAGVSAGTCSVQICKEIYEGVFLIMGYFMYNIFYTGVFWNLESSPLGARIVSWFFPCSWVIEAFRSLLSRGWSVTHQNVWPGYAALIITIVLFWIITFRFWKVRI